MNLKELEAISDGRVYDIDDLVKADAGGCNGCSACCHSVGELVVLSPFDIYEMTTYLGKPFYELLEDKIVLRESNKITLPYLKMNTDSDRCSFLNEQGRCTIHSKRPNICRLFPLGRVYEDNNFKYFLQVGNCSETNLKEVKVRKWIGIDNYNENKEFILVWYKLIKALTFRLKFVRDEEELEDINKDLIDSFYNIQVNEGEDFYSAFYKKLTDVKNRLGII